MRLSIVTLYGMENFGNRLQNYALQRVLENLGHNVETLVVEKRAKGILNEIRREYIINNGKGIQFVSKVERKKRKAFKKFTNKYIHYRVEKYNENFFRKKINSEYDGFVVGSDQVWNPYFWQNQDQNLFLLSFAENKKKISYAASFGIDKLPKDYVSLFASELSHFSSISVREKAGIEIINELRCPNAQVVLDPTMLLDADEWRRISKKYEDGIKDKYIIKLFLNKEKEDVSKYIEEFAFEKKYKIIELQSREKIKYYTCGPDEFIYLIEHAEAVFTDSFHTIVFSILFHIPFVAFERICDSNNNMMSRLYTLLSMFHFDNRIGPIDYSEILECNFNGVDEIIENERKKSMKYLDDALEKISRHNQ